MANRRSHVVAAFSYVAILILSAIGFQSIPGTARAHPGTPQMMGGMGNRGDMQGMMHQMMRDNVPPGVKPQDLPAPNSEGARLTVRYCMQCHALASPSMHTSKEWKVVAARMFRRMSMRSKRGMMGMSVNLPSARQEKMILAYLEAHALKPISPEALRSPNSPGAAAFKSTCSECHALPNPKLQRAGDWSAVVRKMQSYAKQMGKKEITSQQAKEITSYLASHASH